MLRSIALSCLVLCSGASCGGELAASRGEETAEVQEPPPGPALDATTLDATTETAPPLRIAVVSDFNGSYGSTRYSPSVHAAVDRVIAWAPDLVLSTGDMVAGQRRDLDHRGMWTGFHAAVSDRLAASGIPFAVTPGNHDGSAYARFAGERSVFVSEWTPRKPQLEYIDDSRYPLRYSFVVGPVLFVSLDATTVGPLGDEQMAWLAEQLEAGAAQPVKILFSHLPLYAFAHRREREIIGDPALERLAAEHDVTLMLSGHHHAYYPGKRGDLRLVGTACVGAGPRTLIGHGVASERSVLMLEVEGEALRSVEAYGGDAYDAVIPRERLPVEVGLEGARIRRDDL